MSLVSLENIKNLTEKGEDFVRWLADTYRSKNRVRKLLLLDVVIGVIFYPDIFSVWYKFLDGPELNWARYPLYYGLAVGLIFFAAVIEALRRPVRKIEVYDPGERSAVKGLRAFGFNDAEIFARLQRGAMLKLCVDALMDSDFRLGHLVAESGCGKTSFLQAGVFPALLSKDDFPLSVYVKFTREDPLQSVKEALERHAGMPAETFNGLDFLASLKAVMDKHQKEVVLLFDQFEQFYVHHPKPAQRRAFIEELAKWYRQGKSLPVKLLLCVREDFAGKLVELQKALEYSLGPMDIFQLEKFTPAQASAIFQVIAESANLSFDEKFVEEMTLQELADREDGLISPVDIQILALVIHRQNDRLEAD